jgi:hypothetical protein
VVRAPRLLVGTYAIFAPDLYVPLLRKQEVKPGSPMDHPGSAYLKMTGRLKPGIGRRQAEASLATLPNRSSGKPPRKFTLSPARRVPRRYPLPILGAAAFLFAIAV